MIAPAGLVRITSGQMMMPPKANTIDRMARTLVFGRWAYGWYPADA
ncbi:hypothetical protein P9139_01395 [Curtobacterium flaccumfaciens]|nr:hypothetical protein P9139_01395 [Curtobacterium flaccumfaciens]